MAGDTELPHGRFWSCNEGCQQLKSLERSDIGSCSGPADHRKNSICIIFEQCGWTEEKVDVTFFDSIHWLQCSANGSCYQTRIILVARAYRRGNHGSYASRSDTRRVHMLCVSIMYTLAAKLCHESSSTKNSVFAASVWKVNLAFFMDFNQRRLRKICRFDVVI